MPEGRPGAPNLKGSPILFCLIGLVDEARDDMALLNVEVVMGTKDVARNNTSEVTTVLLVISLEKLNK